MNEELIALLRARRIRNVNDRNAAVSLVGWWTVNGAWSDGQGKLAKLLIERAKVQTVIIVRKGGRHGTT